MRINIYENTNFDQEGNAVAWKHNMCFYLGSIILSVSIQIRLQYVHCIVCLDIVNKLT